MNSLLWLIGSAILEDTTRVFTDVAESAEKVANLMGEISTASREQVNGIHEVHSGLAQMDGVTQGNAASAEQAAAASEELNAQAEQMRIYVEELTELVQGARKNGASLQLAGGIA